MNSTVELTDLGNKELHPQLWFTAALLTQGRTLKEVQGGQLLESSSAGAIIEFPPGEVIVVFD